MFNAPAKALERVAAEAEYAAPAKAIDAECNHQKQLLPIAAYAEYEATTI